MADLCVGAKVWIFDINRRVYERKDGRTSGGPIYRKHFIETTIVGETSRSWLVRNVKKSYGGRVVNKKTLEGLYTNDEQIDLAVWAHENAHRIGHAVATLRDNDLLKKIASLIGYKDHVRVVESIHG